MLGNSVTRIILLAGGLVAAIMLLFTIGFAGFAGEWGWERGYPPAQPAIPMTHQRLSSYQDGILLTGLSDAIYRKLTRLDRDALLHTYSKTIRFDVLAAGAPPLLNLQISPDEAAVRARVEQQTGTERARLLSSEGVLVPVTQIITEQDGLLRVSARFLGVVEQQHCGPHGQCVIVFRSPLHREDSVFYSADGGCHWRWLAQWTKPEKRADYQIVGLPEAQTVMVVQEGKLYRTTDFGEHWQPVFDLNHWLAEKGIDPRLYRAHWRYNEQHNVIIWNQAGDEQDGDLLPSSLLINHDLERGDTRSTWVRGSISAGENAPQGGFYFILAGKPRLRYSLNRLLDDATYAPVLETGSKTLRDLYVGEGMLMMAKMYNDPQHMTASVDNGRHWFRMARLPDGYYNNMVFDRWRNRLFVFPRKDYDYPALGNQDGLVYQSATLTP